jgi:hypothetical protein
MTAFANLVETIIHSQEADRNREHDIHKTGYVTLNREMSNYIFFVREYGALEPRMALDKIVELMRNAVTQLYETVEAQYGTAPSIEDHIEFEVTFMTLSLRDSKITIASWANRDGRAPKSLAKRDVKPETYSGTETAKLYADENRAVRIVSSTAGGDYKELYPGQKRRIQSSIVYPVVDDMFALLGTLVVHCDRDGFFSNDDIKVWRELIEPYTKRLALARIAVEKFVDMHPEYRPF